MPYHHFKIGQTVTAHGVGIPTGPYVVTRLLPAVGKDPSYRVKSENGIERALLEPQMRAAVVEHDPD